MNCGPLEPLSALEGNSVPLPPRDFVVMSLPSVGTRRGPFGVGMKVHLSLTFVKLLFVNSAYNLQTFMYQRFSGVVL